MRLALWMFSSEPILKCARAAADDMGEHCLGQLSQGDQIIEFLNMLGGEIAVEFTELDVHVLLLKFCGVVAVSSKRLSSEVIS